MMIQDLLPVKGRIHRVNAEKRCLRKLATGDCQSIQDRTHFFISCNAASTSFKMLKEILWIYLNKKVFELEILHLSFAVSNKNRTRVGIWFALKFMYLQFMENLLDGREILLKIRYDIDEYKRVDASIYKSREFRDLEEVVDTSLR